MVRVVWQRGGDDGRHEAFRGCGTIRPRYEGSFHVSVRSRKKHEEYGRVRDVTVTKNGWEVFHCLSEEQYRAMQDEVVRARLLSHIMRTERELAAGAYDDYDDFAAAVREEYGL